MFRLRMADAVMNKSSISPDCSWSNCWWMVVPIDEKSLWSIFVGARMSSSMWNRSHQNGADFCMVLDCKIDSIILLCRSWNLFFVFPFQELSPCGSEVGGIMIVVVQDEIYSLCPIIGEVRVGVAGEYVVGEGVFGSGRVVLVLRWMVG